MNNLINALKKYKQLDIIDQSDLKEKYGFDWEELNSFLKVIELPFNLKKDEPDEYGFEEAIWEANLSGINIRDTTVYGIGSFTKLELI
jgi:abortive infection bacteriophage resistance protein